MLLGFLHRISRKNCFGKKIQKFGALQGFLSSKFVNFRHTLCNFIMGPYHIKKIRKNSQSTFIICCLHAVKEASPKTKHKKRYREEKSRHFVFEKTSFLVLFALGLELMPYSLSVDLKCLPDILYCVY